MSVRPIDANDLMTQKVMKKSGPANARYTEGWNDASMRFRSMIHSAATLDTVRHACWITDPARCSACNEEQPRDDWEYPIDYPWCPNFGAKMDEVMAGEDTRIQRAGGH